MRSKLLFGSGLAGLGLSGTSCAGTLPMKASARTCVPIQSGKLCVSVASAAADFIPESVADLLRNQHADDSIDIVETEGRRQRDQHSAVPWPLWGKRL